MKSDNGGWFRWFGVYSLLCGVFVNDSVQFLQKQNGSVECAQ